MATKVITFKLTETQQRRLDYNAGMLRLDRSKLIRFILDEYIDDPRLVNLRIERDFTERHGKTAARGWFLDAQDQAALKAGGDA